MFKYQRPFIIFNFSFWVGLSLLTILKVGYFAIEQGKEVYWAHISSYTLSSGLLWILFCFLIFSGVRILLQKQLPISKLLGVMVIGGILVSASQRAISMCLDYFIQTQMLSIEQFPAIGDYFAGHFFRRFTEGLIWYGIIVTLFYLYLLSTQKKVKGPITKQLQLSIEKKGMLRYVALADIIYIKSDRNYCQIHTQNEVHSMRISLKKLEQQLRNSDLRRIHNSYLINENKIVGFDHLGSGEYLFELEGSDKRISSTRTFKDQTQQIIRRLKN
jgi:hypothetical protein